MRDQGAVYFQDYTGRGVRVGIIDSGVHAAHEHVRGIAGGVGIGEDGREHEDFVDRLGHGTAVSAVIREKARDAELFAVKVFDRTLSTQIDCLVRAIDWATQHSIRLVNLSLGTSNPDHEVALQEAIDRAQPRGTLVVAAVEDGVRWLPGSLPAVVGARLSWECPRHEYKVCRSADGRLVFEASGFPRPIPGVPPERNLQGVSFAVANMTGFVARALEAHPHASVAELVEILTAGA